jgi:hypothetical protein
MTRRVFVVAAVTAVWMVPVFADETPGTHEGKVVMAGGGKLVMADKGGKNQHTYTVGSDTNITLDGKAAKLEDLKVGFAVRVTAEKKGDKVMATRIEAKNVDSRAVVNQEQNSRRW